MKTESVMRTTERFVNDDWHVYNSPELNRGDVFGLIEPTNEIVEIVGRRSWVAEGDPALTDDGMWSIQVIGEGND